MQETKETLVPQENVPEETKKDSSKEGLFGALLMIIVMILLIVALGLVGWYGYGKWQGKQVKEQAPSITTLKSNGFQPMQEEKPEQTAAEEPKKEEVKLEAVKDAKTVQISVLNGGAAKGSAGVVADLLKKEGYTKVTAGNTTADYTGTTVYYGSGLEKEAEALKTSLVKKYPQATIKPAVATNKETTTAPLTVILGK